MRPGESADGTRRLVSRSEEVPKEIVSRSVHKIFRPGNFAMEYRGSSLPRPQHHPPSLSFTPPKFLHPIVASFKTTWDSELLSRQQHSTSNQNLGEHILEEPNLLAISLGGKRWVSVVGALSSICNHYCETDASRSQPSLKRIHPRRARKKCRQCKEPPRRRSPLRRAAVQREKILSWAMAAQEDPSLPQTNLKKPIGHSTVYQVRLSLSSLAARDLPLDG